MPAALPLTSAITQAAQASSTYKVIEVRYGNGYSQRARDGINNNQAQWNVTWGVLSTTELSQVLNAFDLANGVDYFTWLAPGDSATKKWIVKQHSRQALTGDQYQLSATLEQVFDL